MKNKKIIGIVLLLIGCIVVFKRNKQKENENNNTNNDIIINGGIDVGNNTNLNTIIPIGEGEKFEGNLENYVGDESIRELYFDLTPNVGMPERQFVKNGVLPNNAIAAINNIDKLGTAEPTVR